MTLLLCGCSGGILQLFFHNIHTTLNYFRCLFPFSPFPNILIDDAFESHSTLYGLFLLCNPYNFHHFKPARNPLTTNTSTVQVLIDPPVRVSRRSAVVARANQAPKRQGEKEHVGRGKLALPHVKWSIHFYELSQRSGMVSVSLRST